MRARVAGLAAAVWLSSAWWMGSVSPAAEPAGNGPRMGILLGDGGSSSRDAREAARKALGLEGMNAEDRRDAESVLRHPTLYRRLPLETFTCDRDLLDFALAKPEVIVDVWRVLGISRLSLDPTAPGRWRMSDGWGTEGTLRLLRHEHTPQGNLLVLLGKGGYHGPLAPQQLTGTCLVLVRCREVGKAADGSARHTMQVDAFLDADGVGLEIVTRSLQGLVCRSSASNLHEICQFMAELSATSGENPAGVARLSARLTKVDPDARRSFAALVRGVADGGIAGDASAGEQATSRLASRWAAEGGSGSATVR